VPAIDLAEVGAGGGSHVWIDGGGSLQVGPSSAGAVPGPVCYDIGGAEPTVTDANVILGYLNPDYLVGGELPINARKSWQAFDEKIARRLGLPVEQTAYGTHRIAASNMIRAIKAASSERGRDVRDYALFAFGGNGPLFAAVVAEALQMRHIVVPPSPGLFSSFGLLYSEIEHHYSRTFWRVLREIDPALIEAALADMRQDALAALARQGFAGRQTRVRLAASMRYKGQSFELTVPIPEGPVTRPGLAALEEAFGQEHEPTYGHRAGPDEPVEIVNLQVIGQAIPARPRVPDAIRIEADSRPRPAQRRVYFGVQRGTHKLARRTAAYTVSTPTMVMAVVPVVGWSW
jgi:N-methylhydantoinase A